MDLDRRMVVSGLLLAGSIWSRSTLVRRAGWQVPTSVVDTVALTVSLVTILLISQPMSLELLIKQSALNLLQNIGDLIGSGLQVVNHHFQHKTFSASQSQPVQITAMHFSEMI